MKILRRLALLLLLASATLCAAKVAPTTLAELVKVSDFILIGRVTRVADDRGFLVATIEVERVLKGKPAPTFEFLAQPTWTCDTSGAEFGERVLLFLSRPRPKPDESAFPDPKGSESLLRIAWSGRGRMPVRQVKGIDYATLWTGDVALPAETTTVGAEREYSSFIRSVRLDTLVGLIEQQSNHGRNPSTKY